ncbi:MAG: type II secretion system F family protein [Candidatus Omnitrophica bacterium]|nr:type II secretion system F family protein [Candidatus Omnitrophota bacterium]
MPYIEPIAFALISAAVLILLNGLTFFLWEERYPKLRQEEVVKSHLYLKEPAVLFSFKFLKPLYFLARPFTGLKYLIRLNSQAEVLLMRVDIEGLVLIKIFSAILFGILTYRFLLLVYAPLGAFIGFFIPDLLIWRKVSSKKDAIVRIFPESVDLLDMCINAGTDFVSAVRWLIDKSDYNSFIQQLGIVLSEIQVGKPRSEALKDMARRLQIPEVNSFVRMITQAERMGTSIEEAFSNLSEDTRAMRFQMGERYAIKASLKILFPLIFCILPAIIIIVAGPIILKFSTGELIPKGSGF